MIASMTGFARRESTGTWGTLVCELRSVNHRFLEAGFRLPDELRAAEGELRARLARQVRRGKVDCTLSYRRLQGAAAPLEVDNAALAKLLNAVEVVTRSLREPSTVNALDVLHWPGVLREDSASDEQRRMLGRYRGDAVLVFLAPTQQADLRVLDPQEKFRASVRLVRALYHLRRTPA